MSGHSTAMVAQTRRCMKGLVARTSRRGGPPLRHSSSRVKRMFSAVLVARGSSRMRSRGTPRATSLVRVHFGFGSRPIGGEQVTLMGHAAGADETGPNPS